MQVTTARRTPRFVYLSDRDARRTPDRAAASYGWRLDAANHRPLARSTRVWPSEAQCRHAATEIRRLVADLVVAVRSAHDESEWRWHARADGVDLAVSVHTYPRRVECSRALQQFLGALADADPAQGVVRHFGPPALRGYRIGTAGGTGIAAGRRAQGTTT